MKEAIQPAEALGKTAVLRALGLSRASFYRHSCDFGPKPASDQNRAERPCRVTGRALSTQERQAVRDLLYGERFVDQTPSQVYAALLDSRSEERRVGKECRL